MPDKESVYYDLVPKSSQSKYLLNLSVLLDKNNIENINTLDIYNKFRLNSNKYIYHLDDTHWNNVGVDIIADTVSKKIKQYNF